MVSVTNPLMDSEIWGANLAGKCVVCRSDKAVAPHPTMGRYICLMRRWRVLSGLVLSLQCRENRPVFSACSPHAVSGLGF